MVGTASPEVAAEAASAQREPAVPSYDATGHDGDERTVRKHGRDCVRESTVLPGQADVRAMVTDIKSRDARPHREGPAPIEISEERRIGARRQRDGSAAAQLEVSRQVSRILEAARGNDQASAARRR